MKLNVKNFGAISSANIDLSKDLIIFTGQNNTGKTYLAYLVYWVNQVKDNITEFPKFMESGCLSLFDKTDNLSYAIDFKKYFDKYISEYLVFFNKKINDSLANFFVANKPFFKDIEVEYSFNKADLSLAKIQDVPISDVAWALGKLHYNTTLHRHAYSLIFNFKQKYITDELLDQALSKALNVYMLFILTKRSHLIPAERQGINLFNKELSLIKNKTFDKLLTNGSKDELLKFLQTRFNKYPKPIQDSLEKMQNLDTVKNTTSEFAYLADELDQLFLDGKIIINKEGDIQFRPENSKQVLEIHMASSTVKSLSSLSIYLRHVAKKRDLIIIDEPELNLHPDNQRKIARFFARLINEGFKILISTHSEYIIRELNNLIMLKEGMQQDSAASKKLLRKYKYNENELLAKKQVGVHLFKKGKAVKNVKVTDTGFDIATIDLESQQLNQSSQDIFFTLFDS